MENEEAIERLHQSIEEDPDFDEKDTEEIKKLIDANYNSITFDNQSVKILRHRVDHFKAIDSKDVFFNGEPALIYGSNSIGKTSFLESIRFNLLGLPKDTQRHELTNPVKEGSKTLTTKGTWSLDEDDYVFTRILQKEGREYTKYDRVQIQKNPENENVTLSSRQDQAELSKKIGLLPFENEGYNRFDIFSLFCLFSDDFKSFLKWNNMSGLLDLLFGINLTSVLNASKRKREEEYSLTELERNAPTELPTKEEKLEEAEQELRSLREDYETTLDEYEDKKSTLDRLQNRIQADDELSQLRSEQSDLKSKRLDLKEDLNTIKEKIRQTEQLINRYDDEQLKSEVSGVAESVRSLVTVPEKCPVCTKSIDSEQESRFIQHADCPLCGKDVPQDRINAEKEHEEREPLVEIQKEHERELEELREKREKLQQERNTLNERINNVNEDLESIQNQLDLKEIDAEVDRVDTLQPEVRSLERDLVDFQIKIDARESEIEDLRNDVSELKEAYDSRSNKKEKQSLLSTFEDYVKEVRDELRKEYKDRLKDRMEALLEIFTDGLFGNAEEVYFPDRGKYTYAIRMEGGTSKPSNLPDYETTEGLLHAMLFHTAILAELSEHRDGMPVRLFMIDSPYANDPDIGNKNDISNFILSLPHVLEDFQILVTTARKGEPDIAKTYSREYKGVDFEGEQVHRSEKLEDLGYNEPRYQTHEFREDADTDGNSVNAD